MTEAKIEKMGFTPDGWSSFVAEVATKFGDGTLIGHEWLREKFGLKQLNLNEYSNVEDFLKAIEDQQWSYMSCIDTLRWELLEQEKMFMKSVRGEGYEIIRPNDQVKYGYDQFVKDVKKSINEAALIMNNVLPIDDIEQKAKDSDLRAKFGLMKQMLATIK